MDTPLIYRNVEPPTPQGNSELTQILNILEWMKDDNLYRAKEREIEWVNSVSDSMVSAVEDQITSPIAKLTKLVEDRTKELSETVKSNGRKIDFLDICNSEQENKQGSDDRAPALDPTEIKSMKDTIAQQQQLIMGQSNVILKLNNDIATLSFQVTEVVKAVSELRKEVRHLYTHTHPPGRNSS